MQSDNRITEKDREAVKLTVFFVRKSHVLYLVHQSLYYYSGKNRELYYSGGLKNVILQSIGNDRR